MSKKVLINIYGDKNQIMKVRYEQEGVKSKSVLIDISKGKYIIDKDFVLPEDNNKPYFLNLKDEDILNYVKIIIADNNFMKVIANVGNEYNNELGRRSIVFNISTGTPVVQRKHSIVSEAFTTEELCDTYNIPYYDLVEVGYKSKVNTEDENIYDLVEETTIDEDLVEDSEDTIIEEYNYDIKESEVYLDEWKKSTEQILEYASGIINKEIESLTAKLGIKKEVHEVVIKGVIAYLTNKGYKVKLIPTKEGDWVLEISIGHLVDQYNEYIKNLK